MGSCTLADTNLVAQISCPNWSFRAHTEGLPGFQVGLCESPTFRSPPFFHTNYHTFEGNIYHTSLWIVTRIRYGIYALVLVEHIRPLILILHHRVKWGLRCRSEQRTGRGELSEETILRNPEIEITSLKAHQITPKMIQFNTASFLVHLGCGIVILPVGSW